MILGISGFLYDTSGYGEMARRLALAASTSVPTRIVTCCTDGGGQQVFELPAQADGTVTDHVIVAAPLQFEALRSSTGRQIGATCWETDRLPESHVRACQGMDGLLVPSRLMVATFAKHGLEAAYVPIPTARPAPIASTLPLPGLEPTDTLFYCVTPETRVLTADLIWKPAGELLFGDKLLGFDENTPPGETRPSRRRKTRLAIVTHTGRIQRHVYELLLSDGTRLCSSAEHPWLGRGGHRENHRWMTTEQIVSDVQRGRRRALLRYFSPWIQADGYDSGYIAGILDGEGHVTQSSGCTRRADGQNHRFVLGLAQKKGIVLDRCLDILRAAGVRYRVYTNPQSGVQNLLFGGGWRAVVSVLGRFRPKRLLEKVEAWIASDRCAMTMNSTNALEVIGARSLGNQEVVALETTTHTYFAEGFAAHNSLLTWQPRKNPMGLLIAFLTEFTATDPVCLVLKIGGNQTLARAKAELAALLQALALPTPPRVHLVGGAWTPAQIRALHAAGDVYVTLTHGEACGIPILDALAAGAAVVSPDWGGQLSFLLNAPLDRVSLVPTRMTPVVQAYTGFDGTQCWADPDLLAAREAMRWQFNRAHHRDKTPAPVWGCTEMDTATAILEALWPRTS